MLTLPRRSRVAGAFAASLLALTSCNTFDDPERLPNVSPGNAGGGITATGAPGPAPAMIDAGTPSAGTVPIVAAPTGDLPAQPTAKPSTESEPAPPDASSTPAATDAGADAG